MALNISGGRKGLDYSVSGSYLDQEGTVVNSSYKRYNFKVNLNADVKSWIKVETSTNFSYSIAGTLKNAPTS